MYGLVLEGGGGRGSYQIGACKAIFELGYDVGMVAGTSVGALNGAMVVQDDVDRAYDIWYSLSPNSVLKVISDELAVDFENIFKADALRNIIHNIRKVIADGGLNVEPLVKLVKSVIDEEKIRKSSIGFGIVTVDITERKAVEIYKEDIPAGQLADYVIASASFPAFRRAVIDGKTYIDGGLYNVLPVNMVSGRGYRDIIVVRTFGIGLKRHVDTSDLNITSIESSESLGSTMDFTNSHSRNNLKLGYYDAHKALRKLKGRKYYILPMHDDRFFIQYLANMSDEKVKKLCSLFGLSACSKRALFEEVVPKAASLLNLPAKASYEDVAVGLLESIAESLSIEKYRFYTVEELHDAVLQKHLVKNEEFIRESPGFLGSRELLPKAVRGKLLKGIANELFTDEIG